MAENRVAATRNVFWKPFQCW